MFIHLSKVSFSYKRGEEILKNIDLTLQQNQITAIRGDNGSGKTTLGKLLVGILKPNTGSIFIDCRRVSEMSLGEIGKQIGYLFQEPERQIFTATVGEELSFSLEINNVEDPTTQYRITELLELFHLLPLIDQFPFLLSRGEKQRLAMASILINQPRFLILDEPTTGLDKVRRSILSELLQQQRAKGVGMLVITHDEAFVNELADRIIILEGGEIKSDTFIKA